MRVLCLGDSLTEGAVRAGSSLAAEVLTEYPRIVPA
jgi:hypothetical protein